VACVSSGAGAGAGTGLARTAGWVSGSGCGLRVAGGRVRARRVSMGRRAREGRSGVCSIEAAYSSQAHRRRRWRRGVVEQGIHRHGVGVVVGGLWQGTSSWRGACGCGPWGEAGGSGSTGAEAARRKRAAVMGLSKRGGAAAPGGRAASRAATALARRAPLTPPTRRPAMSAQRRSSGGAGGSRTRRLAARGAGGGAEAVVRVLCLVCGGGWRGGLGLPDVALCEGSVRQQRPITAGGLRAEARAGRGKKGRARAYFWRGCRGSPRRRRGRAGTL